MTTDEQVPEELAEPVTTNGQGKNPHAIARVSVEGLFGQYNYELPAAGKEGVDFSRLFIMYGENGSGKTTLLKLIYHTLSPEGGQGHRSFLGRTRFNRFAIELADGTVVEAIRRVPQRGGGGSLLLALHREARTLATVELELDEQLGVPDRVKQEDRLKEVLGEIGKLRIRLYYLSDDRRHQGELPGQSKRIDERDVFEQVRSRIAHGWTTWTTVERDIGEDDKESLKKVMDRVLTWVQEQVRKGATTGQGNVYNIYTKVVSDIAHSLDVSSDGSTDDTEHLIQELERLENVSKEYAEYGLIPPFPADMLIQSIREATHHTLPVIRSVVRPHIEGIQARLKALTDIYNTIHSFTKTINTFYRDKLVGFNIDRGFVVRSGKEPLDPRWLSSGEKQLFLLLCNTILARKQASLFLIDEPELSLNVKWQRQLVQAVLDNTEGSNVQFVLATHSVELITQHRNNVVRLRSLPRSTGAKQSSTEDAQHGGGET